jgi:hypothetical protein
MHAIPAYRRALALKASSEAKAAASAARVKPSSLKITPVAVRAVGRSVALLGEDSETKNVSFPSLTQSPITQTFAVAVRCPGRKVATPEAGI